MIKPPRLRKGDTLGIVAPAIPPRESGRNPPGEEGSGSHMKGSIQKGGKKWSGKKRKRLKKERFIIYPDVVTWKFGNGSRRQMWS